MPIYPFEQTVFPARLPSPFIGRSGSKGSAIGKGLGGLVAGEVADQVAVEIQGAGAANGQKRTRTAKNYAGGLGAPGTVIASALTQFTYQPPSTLQQAQGPRSGGPDRSVITAAGGLSALGQDARIEKLPTETGMWYLELVTPGNQSPSLSQQNISTGILKLTKFCGSQPHPLIWQDLRSRSTA